MKRFLQALVLSVFLLTVNYQLSTVNCLAQTSVPSIVAFGANPVGTAMPTQTTLFTNTSAATLASLTVAVGGTNSADFSAVTSPVTNCGGSLTAGSTCTVTITFTPGGVGARTATFTYSWTGGSLVVTLNGTGLVVAPYVTTAYTNATTTFSNVSSLSFPVAASQSLHAMCRVTWQGSAGTTGPKYQFTGPASPTSVAIGMNSIVTATTVIAASATALSTAVANTGTVTTATNFTDTVDIGLINGTTAGTVQLQAAANGAGTLTIQPGSYCTVSP